MKVLDVQGFENERAFVIHFENSYSLLFKMFGQQSNLLLFQNESVKDIFRSTLHSDRAINLNSLDRAIEQSKEAILEVIPKLGSVYPTLNRQTRNFLENEIADLPIEQAYLEVSEFITKLEYPSAYFIYDDDGRIKFGLTPSENVIAEYSNCLEALTEFFKLFLKTNSYSVLRGRLLNEFEKNLVKSTAYISKTKSKLEYLATKQVSEKLPIS